MARDILLEADVNSVVQVIDAKNLEMGLYITTRVSEIGRPLLMFLNIMDEAQQRGVKINKSTWKSPLRDSAFPSLLVSPSKEREQKKLKTNFKTRLFLNQGSPILRL